MPQYNKAAKISSLMILIASLAALTACCRAPTTTVLLPESRVQKMLKGESASYDGFLLTGGALTKILEAAERCKTAP